MTRFYELLGCPQPFDTHRNFVTSPWFSSTVLAAIRGTVALYTLVTLLVILIMDAVSFHNADSYFSFFTELTYIGICSYYWASFTQTLVYALRLRRLDTGSENLPDYPLQSWPRILQLLHVILRTTMVSYPILVTIVFWGILASPSVFKTPFSAWSNISIHALNTVWSLFEMLGTNSPPPKWTVLPFIIVVLALYLGLAYVTKATQGFYPYPFLDPSKGSARLAGYIVGIAVAACIVFAFAKGIMWARMRMSGVRGREGKMVEGDDEERVDGVDEKGKGGRKSLVGSSGEEKEDGPGPVVHGDRMV
ncbi:hypothetical protein D9757_009831 [Collybiopsis confluens]|uniref:FAR-17a/AIG1-like protein n=1 Tax=Collybiopsis confluens TaxID=2823264 RepID=A0A8H5H7S8_9AGAR|nr:hypothetical protein D9757_009831 [Collybiopsis confluens]